LAKLTDIAGVGPRTKNTPPLTPRAMSNETQHTEKRSGPSAASSPARTRPDSSRSNGHGQHQAQPTRVATVPDGQAPPVAPLKGKLTVKISEGRGLRPSYDPYVVCVFEWNEYISKGAQADSANEPQKKSRLDAVGAVAMQRSNSDSGRPMAIPMKSRQSSNNSLMDSHDRKRLDQVTDPLWNHDAVLCVP
jgi:protein-serine/threonine kinase